jgi:peptidoglycan/LPS O-acetylase OafA/YrhL
MLMLRSNPHYRPEIEGLRAIAVLAVVANHFDKRLLPSGHLGVDIFFVISGFVITASLSRRRSESLRDLLLDFYARRIKRLQPALLVFVIAASVLICLVNPTPRDTLVTGIASLFGLSNFVLYNQSINYFARPAELNIFTHTWSLGIEEQFYLVYPLLLWVTGFAPQAKNGTRNLFLVISVLSIFSFAAFVVLARTNQPASFFLVSSRFWELGIGCLAFLLTRAPSRVSRLLAKRPPDVLLLGLLAFLLSKQAKTIDLLGIVIVTALLLYSLRPGGHAYRLLANKNLVIIGMLSYSLYLWHWPIVVLSRWTVGIHLWTVPFQVAFMILLSVASYNWIEDPLRKASWAPTPTGVIRCGVGSAAGSALAISSLIVIPTLSLYVGKRLPLSFYGATSIRNTYNIPGMDANSKWGGVKCVIIDRTDLAKRINPSDCILGDPEQARKRILVAGNSFSAAFVSGFDRLVRDDRYSVAVISGFGGSPVPSLKTYDSYFQPSSDYFWNKVFPSFAGYLKPGDWIFLVSDLAYFSPEVSVSDTLSRLQELQKGLTRFKRQYGASGVNIAILHGLPFARDANCDPVVASRQWFNSIGDGPCVFFSKEQTLKRRAGLDVALMNSSRDNGIEIVDLMPEFCPAKRCTYNGIGDIVLYRDSSSHPSLDAVRAVAPRLRSVFMQ